MGGRKTHGEWWEDRSYVGGQGGLSQRGPKGDGRGTDQGDGSAGEEWRPGAKPRLACEQAKFFAGSGDVWRWSLSAGP